MNTQKIKTNQSNKNPIIIQFSKYLSELQTRYQNQAVKIVPEHKPKSNKLLFGITVAALMSIMGGTIFLAINQYQPQKASMNLINNNFSRN